MYFSETLITRLSIDIPSFQFYLKDYGYAISSAVATKNASQLFLLSGYSNIGRRFEIRPISRHTSNGLALCQSRG